jgi:RNA polymerase sigma-70 factor (ECF subfamily)
LFSGLLEIDLQSRRQNGQTADANAYRTRFPEFTVQIEDALIRAPTLPVASASAPKSSAAAGSGSSTDASLLAGLKSAVPAAWQRFVDLYGPLIYSWCRRVELQPEDAADVVQEVFRVVWGAIARFRHDETQHTFRGWLRTITRNKVLDHYRAAAVQPASAGGSVVQMRFLDQPADEDEAPASTDGGPLAGLVHRALGVVQGEFEARTWRAFWMAVVEDQPPADIAAALGISPAAVRQAKYKVLRRLRLELGDAT